MRPKNEEKSETYNEKVKDEENKIKKIIRRYKEYINIHESDYHWKL